jgi:preprotein translocase subunit SecD
VRGVGRYRGVVVATLLVAIVAIGLAACDDGGSSGSTAPRGRMVFQEVGPTASPHDAERAASIMEARLRRLGVDDANVVVKGRTLVATGTGLTQPASIATKPGLLEFRPVVAILPADQDSPPGDAATVPSADEVLPARPIRGSVDVRYGVGPVALTGADLSGAKAEFIGGQEGWVVITTLTNAGHRKFNDLAHTLYPKTPPQNAVAIGLDGVVQSAPAFQTDSFSGDIQITGNFTKKQAEQLAVVLNTGAMPVHLQVAPAAS